MGKGKKIVIGLIAFFLLAAACIYGGGIYFFSSHFLPGSSLNGRDVSYQSAGEIQKDMAAEVKNYTLTLYEIDGGQETITGKQMGLKYGKDADVAGLIQAQNPWAWILSLHQTKTYTMDSLVTYNQEKLAEAVAALGCFGNIQEPRDAYIQVAGNGYDLIPEMEGNLPDQKKITAQVKKAVKIGKTALNLVDAGCYTMPAVYRDDENLTKQFAFLNQTAGAKITYDFEDRNEVVDANTIINWAVQGEDGNYRLDNSQLEEYVHQLAVKYDTCGMERDFRTMLGEPITIKGGDYGWAISEEKEVQALKANIEAGEEVIREPEYLSRGYCREQNDIGYTYVEIDLANQRMCYYLNGSLLVDASVVTGSASKKSATPTGIYALAGKESPAGLKGADHPSPVSYWMPFHGDVGIHDAPWRTDFGGTVYQKDGSCGCVDIPADAAEEIYNNIEIGVPIIIY